MLFDLFWLPPPYTTSLDLRCSQTVADLSLALLPWPWGTPCGLPAWICGHTLPLAAIFNRRRAYCTTLSLATLIRSSSICEASQASVNQISLIGIDWLDWPCACHCVESANHAIDLLLDFHNGLFQIFIFIVQPFGI